MAVRSLDEILVSLNAFAPAEPTDDFLNLLEDISDTMATSSGWEEEVAKLRKALEESVAEAKQIERDWRQRYKERFYGSRDESFAKQEAEDLKEPETEVIESSEEIAKDW